MQTDKTKKVSARVKIPGSKSISHRAAIAAALAHGESELKEFLLCEDTLYTVSALEKLGVILSFSGLPSGQNETQLRVKGRGGVLSVPPPQQEIYLGNSGTSLRLLVSVSALARGDIVLTGTSRLNERPIGELIEALSELGVKANYLKNRGRTPVRLSGGQIKGGRVRINASKSSQFISSLLLAAPYSEKDVEIEVTGTPVSLPYVDLTIDVMKRFGAKVNQEGYRYFRVKAGQRYKGQNYSIEGDVSSASYFWAAAAVSEGMVVTENIYPYSTRQGDIKFLNILDQMGCQVEKEIDRVTVRGGELKGIEVDMGQMPDMVPTLAALALFARGRTRIRNVAHLRHKESDRLRAIATEWRKLGAKVEELADGLTIQGRLPLEPAMVDPHNDHRIAMSLAVVGLRVKGVKIREKTCVRKSYPGFWDVWQQFGP